MDITKIVEKYYKLVYKICLDMLLVPSEAEDAVQDSYFRLYQNYDRYKQLEEKDIKNILCKIALNRCKDILKSGSYKINSNTQSDEIIDLNIIEEDLEIIKIFEEEDREYLIKTIQNLKCPYNELIMMYYINQMKLDEIADKKNIPKATLKVQIYRAKEMLRENLIKDRGGGYFEEYTRKHK